jgi:hypothetical protein
MELQSYHLAMKPLLVPTPCLQQAINSSEIEGFGYDTVPKYFKKAVPSAIREDRKNILLLDTLSILDG